MQNKTIPKCTHAFRCLHATQVIDRSANKRNAVVSVTSLAKPTKTLQQPNDSDEAQSDCHFFENSLRDSVYSNSGARERKQDLYCGQRACLSVTFCCMVSAEILGVGIQCFRPTWLGMYSVLRNIIRLSVKAFHLCIKRIR